MADESLDDLDPEMLVRMGCIETLNQGDIDEADKYYTEDADYYRSDDEKRTYEELKQDSVEFQEAISDIEADIAEVVVDGDEVMFDYTIRGTQDGELREIPPTGETFECTGIGYARLEGGRIAEYNLSFDRLGMLKQLGVAQ